MVLQVVGFIKGAIMKVRAKKTEITIEFSREKEDWSYDGFMDGCRLCMKNHYCSKGFIPSGRV